MNIVRHICVVAVALLLCLGLPAAHYHAFDRLLGGEPDAVTSASMELPEQPSGEFVILINAERHARTLDEWEAFFSEKEVGVIMEDISCLAIDGDAAGTELADRYRLRLAENQMKLRMENGVLVVSRAEAGIYDVIIMSRDVADAFDCTKAFERTDTKVIRISSAA